MEEILVSFQVAKLAKEKGFKVLCHFLYNGLKNGEKIKMTNKNGLEEWYSAPTQSLLQKWIREVHGIDVIALPTSSSKYIFRLYQKGKTCKNQIYGDYMSKEYANYEEALEKGLFQALKLIENE